MTRPLLILAAVLLFLPNLFRTDLNNTAYATPPYDQKEKFDPSLSSINTIPGLIRHIDQLATTRGIAQQSADYAALTEDVISKRFYHGFSHLDMSENWIAAFSEKLFGHGLSCKVDPKSIMKHENAACSQQCMVMMEVLKQKGIPYRKVGFPHHYAIETRIGDTWYFFDPNMEPNITMEERKEQNWKCCADNLKKHYDTNRFIDLDYKFGKNIIVAIGPVNETPALNAKRFQSATAILSKMLWLFPFLLAMAWKPARRKHFISLPTLIPFAQWLRLRRSIRPAGLAS